jgi:alanyl-tRNA synthetase
MTDLLYRDHPDLLRFEAVVLACRDRGGRPAVILDRTAFYPEGGGQPSDTGRLAGVAVREVVEVDGDILHVLETPLPEGPVTGEVDAARRLDHTQQHHGQHLLSRSFVETAGARTIGFHLGADAVSIDLDREVDPTQVRSAELLANRVVWEARPVSIREVPRAEAEALGLEPAAHAGDAIRLVEVEGFDCQPCSGTHPRHTAQVGMVLVLGHERYKSGTRVHFGCGQRAADAFHDRSRVVERLGALFSAPLETLPDAAERLLGQVKDLERRGRDLLEAALDGEASRMRKGAGATPSVIVATFEKRPADELRRLAQKLTALGPGLALLASRDAKAHLVFARSDDLDVDVGALLRQAAARLGGKGGGRGSLAQGGGSPEGLDDALAEAERAARAALASPS